MKKELVLIFDIGKTNKKFLLIDRQLNIYHEEETQFPEITDDDGFPADDIIRIEDWIRAISKKYISDPSIKIRGINFSTYGATLVYLDGHGNRLTPLYNYLKPMPEGIVEKVYESFSGVTEFCRRTASPALGMLNSGFQALWLQEIKPDVFSKVETILHFPQYLSYYFTGRESTEHTSIGCHTALWDFDQMQYHVWTTDIQSCLPEPVAVETTYPSKIFKQEIPVGIGIHDSSASLVPYLMSEVEPFILMSTGTWCISMNPFNNEPLTAVQLENDCLAYLSIRREPVKSSRLFMGHIHDVNVKRISGHFGVSNAAYKKIKFNADLLDRTRKDNPDRLLFKHGNPKDYIDLSFTNAGFNNFTEAYYKLMIDLTEMSIESLKLVIAKNDVTKNIFVSGGFSKNEIFTYLLKKAFPGKNIFTSEIANATSVGTAMVLWKAIDPSFHPEFDLGLKLK